MCGGETRTGTRYTARCEDKTLVSLPSIECVSCGAIQPDRKRISSMPPEEVPSSVLGERLPSTLRYVGDTVSPPPPTVEASGEDTEPETMGDRVDRSDDRN